jgi:hypothetical protein
MDDTIGTNINGPSLIRVPEWVENPLGRYYLFFAHHQGEFIRLAYADRLTGPWKVYRPGVLRLSETVCSRHIASPDVHVDKRTRQILMYFHGIHAGDQVTFLATSRDGLHFSAETEVLGPFYFRVFAHQGWFYAIAKHYNTNGLLLRSRDGRTPFEGGRHILPRMRHVALRKENDVLEVFFTQVGDEPERILLSRMALAGDWRSWQPSDPVEILAPERDYEGVQLPLGPSRSGAIHVPTRQLRDPAIYEQDGRVYLLYSVAGESGIAIAELTNDN